MSTDTKSLAALELKQDIKAVAFLKGLAITAVVLLHILANLKGGVFTTHPWHVAYIFLDQVNRFCVPLFIALSGYALAKKYLGQPISVWEFFTRRAVKLLPLYLVWSLALGFILTYEPMWSDFTTSYTFVEKLLYGRSDYHLYFVPMIFQLYLLFPFLLMALRKSPKVILLSSAVIQLGTLMVFGWIGQQGPDWHYFVTDQQQYSLSLVWIFYFVLGMFIAEKQLAFRKRGRGFMAGWGLLAGAVGLMGLGWTMESALLASNQGVDPILFLKFTRLPVMVFASGITAWWILGKSVLKYLPELIFKFGVWLGKESYLIYLCHTMILRIWFSIGQGVSTSSLVLATGLVVATIGLSKVVEKRL